MRFLATALLLAGPCFAAADLQSPASFEAAIRDPSTSPFYVRITVASPDSPQGRTTCVNAHFLLGALMREHGLPWDAEGNAQAQRLALAPPSHRFEFSRPQALANLPITFDDDDLAVMRSRLARYSPDELVEGFQGQMQLQTALDGAPAERPRAFRDAAACVMIERGLSVRLTDIGGALRVTR